MFIKKRENYYRGSTEVVVGGGLSLRGKHPCWNFITDQSQRLIMIHNYGKPLTNFKLSLLIVDGGLENPVNMVKAGSATGMDPQNLKKNRF